MIPTSPERIARGLYWQRAWSLIEGCSPVSEACRFCWSAAQTHMRARQSNPKIVARYGGLTNDRGQFNGTVRPMHESLEIPLRVRKPTTWAVWNDLFHLDVPDSFIAAVFGVMAACPQHTFTVLSKRAERLPEWFQWFDWLTAPGLIRMKRDKLLGYTQMEAWKGGIKSILGGYRGKDIRCDSPNMDVPWPLPNVIIGTTVEDQATADERIPLLLDTPAATRVVSLEPMLAAVDIEGSVCRSKPVTDDILDAPDGASVDGMERHRSTWERQVGIDWVIAGCESGRNARETKDDWLRQVRDQCQEAGVPFFLKQMQVDGRLVKMPELDGRRWAEFPG